MEPIKTKECIKDTTKNYHMHSTEDIKNKKFKLKLKPT